MESVSQHVAPGSLHPARVTPEADRTVPDWDRQLLGSSGREPSVVLVVQVAIIAVVWRLARTRSSC